MKWVEQITPDWNHWNTLAWLGRSPPEAVLAHFGESDEEFSIRFFEDLLVQLGDQYEVLVSLGELYTRVGRYREGLAVDRRLSALRPRDPVVAYNLACSYSLLKQKVRAFAALRRAIELGYRDFKHVQQDPDLENLRQDPRWSDIASILKS
jgi:tetratricopeptide (TPR) repeat protein